MSVMSIRTYKLITVGLTLVTIFVSWRCFILYRQMATAAFIDAQCENTTLFIETDDPTALAHDVTFLMGYYDYYSKALVGSPIAGIVQRDYQQALTNAVVAFRRMGTNDLGGDPRLWIQKYGYMMAAKSAIRPQNSELKFSRRIIFSPGRAARRFCRKAR